MIYSIVQYSCGSAPTKNFNCFRCPKRKTMCRNWGIAFIVFLLLFDCNKKKESNRIVINDIKNKDSIVINTNCSYFTSFIHENFHPEFYGDWHGSQYFLFYNSVDEEFISFSVKNGIGNLKEATRFEHDLMIWLYDTYYIKKDSLNSIYSEYYFCNQAFSVKNRTLIDIKASLTKDYNFKIELIDQIVPNKQFLYYLRFTSNNKLYNITYTTKNIELIYSNYFGKEFYNIVPKK